MHSSATTGSYRPGRPRGLDNAALALLIPLPFMSLGHLPCGPRAPTVIP